jgi:DNA repair photolyase
LRRLRERGLATYAFVSPFLPGITNLDQLFDALHGSIDEIGVEAINPRGGNWRGIERALKADHPDLLRECGSLSRDSSYWSELELRAVRLAKQYDTRMMGFYMH